MSTTDNLFSSYPNTDKETVPSSLALLQRIEFEQYLAHDLKKYYYAQLAIHGVLLLWLLALILLFILNISRELLFFCAAIAVLVLLLSLCITHFYHEAVKSKDRYERLVKDLNTRSRNQ